MTVGAPLPLRVAVVLPAKKWKKHGFERSDQITFVPLEVGDLNAAALKRLQVDMVLHKLGDFLPDAARLETIERELALWGGHLVDNIRRVSFLNDRRRICKLLGWFTRHHASFGLHLPPTSECTSPPSVAFPLIRKPLVACGAKDSHHMCIYYTPELLEPSPDFLLQQFIPHHSLLYKVYVIGDQVRIQLRPSLGTEEAAGEGQDYQHRPPRPFNSQALKHLDTILPGSERQAQALQRLAPHRKAMIDFTHILQKELELDLFGWDLIIEEGTGRLYIIDINYFPGYDEVDFLPLLTQALLRRASQTQP